MSYSPDASETIERARARITKLIATGVSREEILDDLIHVIEGLTASGMLASILVRVSGGALAVGALFVVAWLAALAFGPDAYAGFTAWMARPADSISLRMGRCRAFLLNSVRNTFTCPPPSGRASGDVTAFPSRIALPGAVLPGVASFTVAWSAMGRSA